MRIHFTDHKTPLQEGMVPDYSWAPKYTQPQSEPPDYQHNVYIPGTTSDYSTLKLAPRGELDVYNSFSTFGKKKKFISHYEQSFDGDDALISNAIFKWFTRYKHVLSYIIYVCSECQPAFSFLTLLSFLWSMFGPEVYFCFSVNTFGSLMLPRSQKWGDRNILLFALISRSR